MTLEDIWRKKSNEELLAASTRLGEYTQVGRQVIVAELERRRGTGSIDNVSGGETAAKLLHEASAPDGQNPVPYVRRLWRGEVALPVSYWVWGVLVSALVRVLIIIAAIITGSLTILRGLGLLYLAFYLYLCVAIWRSAGLYAGRRIWGDLARLSLLLPVIIVIANFLIGE